VADPTTNLDALVAQYGPLTEQPVLNALDALRTRLAGWDEAVAAIRQMVGDHVGNTPLAITATVALLKRGHEVAEARLAQVEGERDRLLHEAGNCPDDCALDHEPRTVRGMSCPAGCSARMIPDYVETHLTMCPAVQTALRAVIATLTTQIGEAWLEYEIANNGRRADAAAYEAHRRVCGR